MKNFNPRAHKTVHEFVAPSVYILEIHRDMCLDGSQLELIDRIALNDSMPPYPWDPTYDEAATQAYDQRLDKAKTGWEAWYKKINEIVGEFIDYHKQNKSKIQVTGIHIDMYGYSVHGVKSWDGIQTFNITFKTEDARAALADYLDQRGCSKGIHCFSEKPTGSKKLWKPVT